MSSILIDCRLLGSGGIEKIFTLLLSYFKDKEYNISILCNYEHQEDFEKFNLPIVFTALRPISIKSTFTLWAKVKFSDYNYVIFPHSQYHFCPLSGNNQIYFINDIFHIDYYYTNIKSIIKALSLYISIRLILKNAKKAVTISKFSAHRISKVFKLPQENELKVVNPIVVENKFSRKFEKIEKNVVSIGTIRPHKNQIMLFMLANKFPEINFQIIGRMGSDSIYEEEFKLCLSKSSNVKWYKKLSDDQVDMKLNSALCVIQCSKYEGFGLPLIEAQMRGVAVLCSDIEVFKEIAGKGAIYFDPNDDSDLFNKFETFIKSNFEQLIANGYENCDRFYANELNTQLRLLMSE